MATVNFATGTTRTQLLDLSTLASATYITSSAIDRGASQAWDIVIEVECNPNGAPSGNKQLVVFAKLSIDNTNYGSGPESGTTATEEADLHFLGVVPTVDTNDHRKFFSLEGLPKTRYLKIVVKNDMGVALTSGKVYTEPVNCNVA